MDNNAAPVPAPKKANTLTPPPALMAMLSYKRPGNSETEIAFIKRFILPLDVKVDGHGNYWKWVVNADGSAPNIMWSVHTDTVHHRPGFQEIEFRDGFLRLTKPKIGECLGADDGAGLWLVWNMIKKQVPGLYLFHRGEESGGTGSKYISQFHAELLKGIKFAVALDRRGYDSVITQQWGGRCCSEAFAKQMSMLLGGKYKPDPTGTFTDTANYIDIIPECTNLSVGYFSQHGPREEQDVKFLMALRGKLCRTDWSVLEAHRDPAERKTTHYFNWAEPTTNSKTYQRETEFYSRYPGYGTLGYYVKENPEFIADILKTMGFTESSLDAIRKTASEQKKTVADLLLEEMTKDADPPSTEPPPQLPAMTQAASTEEVPPEDDDTEGRSIN